MAMNVFTAFVVLAFVVAASVVVMGGYLGIQLSIERIERARKEAHARRRGFDVIPPDQSHR